MNWYFEVLNKYATFDGRAHREEYWMFFLLSTLVSLLFLALDLALQLHSFVFNGIYTLVAFIPATAVGVRRMHDTGRSGWWLLLPIVNLIFLVLDSQSGDNRFGPNPKADAAYSSPKIIQTEANITNDKQHSFVAVDSESVDVKFNSNMKAYLPILVLIGIGMLFWFFMHNYTDKNTNKFNDVSSNFNTPITSNNFKYSKKELYNALKHADAAGDEASAIAITQEIQRQLNAEKNSSHKLGSDMKWHKSNGGWLLADDSYKKNKYGLVDVWMKIEIDETAKRLGVNYSHTIVNAVFSCNDKTYKLNSITDIFDKDDMDDKADLAGYDVYKNFSKITENGNALANTYHFLCDR